MKNILRFASIATLVIASCTKPTTTTTNNNNNNNCTVVEYNTNAGNTNIKAPTVWKSGNVYMITNSIYIKSVLTIEAGAIIKLQNAEINISDVGKIIAKGTSSNHIVFTSYADDSY
jgi:hypothetical protein